MYRSVSGMQHIGLRRQCLKAAPRWRPQLCQSDQGRTSGMDRQLDLSRVDPGRCRNIHQDVRSHIGESDRSCIDHSGPTAPASASQVETIQRLQRIGGVTVLPPRPAPPRAAASVSHCPASFDNAAFWAARSSARSFAQAGAYMYPDWAHWPAVASAPLYRLPQETRIAPVAEKNAAFLMNVGGEGQHQHHHAQVAVGVQARQRAVFVQNFSRPAPPRSASGGRGGGFSGPWRGW